MAVELFSAEYNYIKDQLKNNDFSGSLSPHVKKIKSILDVDGPDQTHAPHLESYRQVVINDEADRILEAAGVDAKANTAPQDVAVVKAATLKFLRHLYFMSSQGSQSVWVFSSPADYNAYPSNELWNVKTSTAQITTRLKAKKERFSDTDKKNLAEASLTALNWCMKTRVILSNAKTSPVAKSFVKRWFADDNTTDQQLNNVIDKLANGFAKVVSTLQSTKLIYTDMASLRNATGGQEKSLLESEAFVFAGRYEKLPIIYIENAFFKSGVNVLSGPANWARIIIHEITHLDVSTEDKQYGWAGLKPGDKISCANAAVNADSWAYFAANCGGALTESDINRVMKGL